MSRKTIYVVDDNAEFRYSVEWLLQAAGFQVHGFESPVLALNHLSERWNEQRDAQQICILLDVRMPEMSGLDLHDALHARGLYPPVIYMTGHGAVPLAVEAMKKGAVTFLEKPFDDAALQSALDIAFSGKFATLEQDNNTVRPEAADVTDDELERGQQVYQQRYAKLTPREREVLQSIVDGNLNKVIAYNLNISIKTVEVHRARLNKKLKAKTLPELVKMVLTRHVEQA